MPQNFLYLQGRRFARIVQETEATLEIERPLVFWQRTASVPATDEDITGRFSGNVFAADVIGEDAKALTYEAGKLEFQRGGIANLKIGSSWTPQLLRKFYELQNGAGLSIDTKLFGDSLALVARNLIEGIRQRADSMVAGLFLDQYSYHRLGIRLDGTFNTPQDLKVTPEVPWTDAANCTPIADIRNLVQYAQDEYGEVYDTLVLPRKDKELILKSAEYQTYWKFANRVNDVNITVSPFDPQVQSQLANILQVGEIIESDANFRQRETDGSITQQRVHPFGKVILTSARYFNNPAAYDWANGVVTESIMAGVSPIKPAGLDGPARGPLGYLVSTNLDFNPPGLASFAVMRGFPRKHNETMNAVLSVR